ncbi:MAG: diaminopimelate epimerase, partial [Candidatus Eisenbacteria bacterium]|nr:diaminopimelate epimerase [Candidatus Eisenbacteria bacterium]
MARQIVLPFEKWSGAGNDFLLVHARDLLAASARPALTRRLCARRTGIGADGLIVLRASTRAAEYRNADGRRAAFCGNGARCVGARLLQDAAVEEV